MMLLSVDPGIRGCGIASFDLLSGALQQAAYVASPVARGSDVAACVAMARAVTDHLRAGNQSQWVLAQWTRVACEWPQVYTPGKQKGDPNDLLALVGVSAAIAALLPCANIHTYLPAQWKAQIPKGVTRRRIEDRLPVEERQRVWLPTVASLQHNVFDAIGIGMHHLGRFERYRHIAR